MHLFCALYTQQHMKQTLKLTVRMVMEQILARMLNSIQRRNVYYEQRQDLPGGAMFKGDQRDEKQLARKQGRGRGFRVEDTIG